MPIRTVVLLVLAFPAGVVGYLLAAQVVSALGLPEPANGLLALFLPLLVAGLFALPFLVPFVDYKAKQALANRPPGPGDGRKDG